MFVEIIRLRHEGQKLDSVALSPPTRGCLRTEVWTLLDMHTGQSRLVRSARLANGYANYYPDSLPPLHDVQLTRMDGRGFVLVGMESTPGGKFKQAWAVAPQAEGIASKDDVKSDQSNPI